MTQKNTITQLSVTASINRAFTSVYEVIGITKALGGINVATLDLEASLVFNSHNIDNLLATLGNIVGSYDPMTKRAEAAIDYHALNMTYEPYAGMLWHGARPNNDLADTLTISFYYKHLVAKMELAGQVAPPVTDMCVNIANRIWLKTRTANNSALYNLLVYPTAIDGQQVINICMTGLAAYEQPTEVISKWLSDLAAYVKKVAPLVKMPAVGITLHHLVAYTTLHDLHFTMNGDLDLLAVGSFRNPDNLRQRQKFLDNALELFSPGGETVLCSNWHNKSKATDDEEDDPTPAPKPTKPRLRASQVRAVRQRANNIPATAASDEQLSDAWHKAVNPAAPEEVTEPSLAKLLDAVQVACAEREQRLQAVAAEFVAQLQPIKRALLERIQSVKAEVDTLREISSHMGDESADVLADVSKLLASQEGRPLLYRTESVVEDTTEAANKLDDKFAAANLFAKPPSK